MQFSQTNSRHLFTYCLLFNDDAYRFICSLIINCVLMDFQFTYHLWNDDWLLCEKHADTWLAISFRCLQCHVTSTTERMKRRIASTRYIFCCWDSCSIARESQRCIVERDNMLGLLWSLTNTEWSFQFRAKWKMARFGGRTAHVFWGNAGVSLAVSHCLRGTWGFSFRTAHGWKTKGCTK